MNKTLIAFDPGASGGIAWQIPGQVACVKPMPETEGDLIILLRDIAANASEYPVVVYMENLVRFMGTRTPSSHMAVYASNWGFIKGALMMRGHPLNIIAPQKWQKALGLGITGKEKARAITVGEHPNAEKEERKRVAAANAKLKKDWKNKLKSEAQRLFPHLDVTLKTADALLILQYAITIERLT